MSQPHTRKSFIAKVLGAIAATGLIAPRLAAGPTTASAPAVEGENSPAPFKVKTDPRSVSRASDTV